MSSSVQMIMFTKSMVYRISNVAGVVMVDAVVCNHLSQYMNNYNI